MSLLSFLCSAPTVINAFLCSSERTRLARTRVNAHRGEALSRQATVNQQKHVLLHGHLIHLTTKIFCMNILKYINYFKIGEEIRWHHVDLLYPVQHVISAFILTGDAGNVACRRQSLLFGTFQSQRRTERSGRSLPRNTDYTVDITASPQDSPAAVCPVCLNKGRRVVYLPENTTLCVE